VPRAALTRERILQAGIRLADMGGSGSITMRKLGRALGVEAMSLYNHVANKDDLLDGMIDLVFGEIDLSPAGADWEERMRASAVSAHDAFLRHPWACGLILDPGTPRVIPARARYMESILGRLRDAGFSAELTYHGYHALDSHILGFTLWEIGHALPPGDPAELFAGFQRLFPVSEFPHLAEHVRQHMTDGSHRDVGAFEFGLGLILDGLTRMRG